MADQRDTGISWTDETWNPVVGCSIVSPACTNCYAMGMAARIERMSGGTTHYAGTTKTVNGKPVWTGKLAMAPDHIVTAPLRWKRPRRVFVNSMSDLFHEDMPDDWIDRVFAVMALARQHTFQVLTKRPERMKAYMLERWQGTPERTIALGRGETLHIPAGGETGRGARIEEACEPLLEAFGLVDTQNDALWTEDGRCKAMQWKWPLPNVWLGVTAEDQARADERIPHLLATPAAVRFVSAEPLLGPIKLHKLFWPQSCDCRDHVPSLNALDGTVYCVGCCEGAERIDIGTLDWVIAGGESGPGARPTHPDWARSIRDQCAAVDVAFHFKQWGDWIDEQQATAQGKAPGEAMFDGDGRPTGDRWHFYDRADPIGGAAIRLGKSRAGRTLDGKIHDAFPEAR